MSVNFSWNAFSVLNISQLTVIRAWPSCITDLWPVLRSIEIMRSLSSVFNFQVIDNMSVLYGMPWRVGCILMLSFIRCQITVETLLWSNQCATTDERGWSVVVQLDKSSPLSAQTSPFSATVAWVWIGVIAPAINRHSVIDKRALITMFNGTISRNDSCNLSTLRIATKLSKTASFPLFEWLSASNSPKIHLLK